MGRDSEKGARLAEVAPEVLRRLASAPPGSVPGASGVAASLEPLREQIVAALRAGWSPHRIARELSLAAPTYSTWAIRRVVGAMAEAEGVPTGTPSRSRGQRHRKARVRATSGSEVSDESAPPSTPAKVTPLVPRSGGASQKSTTIEGSRKAAPSAEVRRESDDWEEPSA